MAKVVQQPDYGLNAKYMPNSEVWKRMHTGMLAWLGHRISGIGILVYLLMHITLMGTSMINGPEAFNATLEFLTSNPILKVGEFVLFAAVVYHGLNGIRLLLFDLGIGFKSQKQIFWTFAVIGAVIYFYSLYRYITLHP